MPNHPAPVPAADRATPRPWRVRQSPMAPDDPDECIVESAPLDGKPYRQQILAADYFDGLSKRADAELIVTAVNAHASLVAENQRLREALEKLLTETEPLLDCDSHNGGCALCFRRRGHANDCAFVQARAVLAEGPINSLSLNTTGDFRAIGLRPLGGNVEGTDEIGISDKTARKASEL